MKNTTITIDQKTLDDARSYAAKFGFSFNAWVNKLIEQAIHRAPQKSMEKLLETADRIAGSSKGKRWTRDEIYERQKS